MKAVLRLSDELVAELLATDHLVIATPVYNYNVPAALKAWIDHIVPQEHDAWDGRQGSCHRQEGDRLARLRRRLHGGLANPGPGHRDPVPALILNVIGITDVTFVAAGNAKSVDMGETGMDAFVDRFQAEIDAEAA